MKTKKDCRSFCRNTAWNKKKTFLLPQVQFFFVVMQWVVSAIFKRYTFQKLWIYSSFQDKTVSRITYTLVGTASEVTPNWVSILTFLSVSINFLAVSSCCMDKSYQFHFLSHVPTQVFFTNRNGSERRWWFLSTPTIPLLSQSPIPTSQE